MSCAARRLTTIESDCSSAREKALSRARGNCVTAGDTRAGDLKPADFSSNERAVPRSVHFEKTSQFNLLPRSCQKNLGNWTEKEIQVMHNWGRKLTWRSRLLLPCARGETAGLAGHFTGVPSTHSAGAPAPTAHMSLLCGYEVRAGGGHSARPGPRGERPKG
jgi:hypothetical protein